MLIPGNMELNVPTLAPTPSKTLEAQSSPILRHSRPVLRHDRTNPKRLAGEAVVGLVDRPFAFGAIVQERGEQSRKFK